MSVAAEIPFAEPRRSLFHTPSRLAHALSVDALSLAIYDDHTIARSGMPALLVKGGIRVVDAAPIDPEIAARGIAPAPDVAVVSDGDGGDELARRLAEERGIPVLRLMSTAVKAGDMLTVLGIGASGAVCRRCTPERVRRAIDTLARGGMSFDCPHAVAASGAASAPILSPRERRVATELARGATTEEIAESLFLSPHTVRTHIRNIQRKLGARTRAQAIAVAIANRELAPPQGGGAQS